MSDLMSAIKEVCEQKGLSVDAVIVTIESALAAAYRKDFGEKNQNIKVEFNPETGKSKVYDVKTVVEDLPEEELAAAQAEAEAASLPAVPAIATVPAVSVEGAAVTAAVEGEEEKKKFNPKTDLQLTDAKLLKKTAKVGDEIKTKLEVPAEYGRMAAQTAKQVIIQRLREAERNLVYGEFKDKEKEVVSGVVQRREGRVILVDLGKGIGIIPPDEQIMLERYRPGDRIKVYVREVNLTPKGPEIILSRTSDEILRKVFYLEIPEIANGLIELKAVAREAGSRAKVAVEATGGNVDPIGSCVGQRGARIQTIISELGGEKVDIIEYSDDPERFIANALSPAKIVGIETDPSDRKARVTVAADQLSLAIGKGGQNARLAARLTGWRIDIVDAGSGKPAEIEEPAVEAEVLEATDAGGAMEEKEGTEGAEATDGLEAQEVPVESKSEDNKE